MDCELNNYVNQVAFCTILTASAGTVLSAMATGSATTALKTAGCAALTLGYATATGSAVTAWFDPSSKNVKNYFNNVKSHFGMGASAVATAISQTVASAVVEGFRDGLRHAIEDKVYRWMNSSRS